MTKNQNHHWPGREVQNIQVGLTISRWLLPSFLALLVACLVLFQPAFLDVFISPVDHRTHLHWLINFHASLVDGVLIPRWSFASFGGLGAPTFLYYSPLFYYVASTIIFFVSDAALALRLMLLLANTILGIVVFASLATFMPRVRALFGMALIQALPAILMLQTSIGAFPWVFAFPFVLAFTFESAKELPRANKLGMWLAVCVLSHVLSAFMVLMFVGVGQLLRVAFRGITLKSFRNWLGGVALGLTLSAFYLLSALTLQGYINPAGWTNDISLDWRRGFAFPIITYFQYGLRWFAFQYPFPVLALVTAVAAWLLGRDERPKVRSLINALVLYTAVALVLASELAYPLYFSVSPMQKLQWPYRFVLPALLTAGLALALALGLGSASKLKPSRSRFLAWSCVCLSIMFHAWIQFGLAKEGRPTPPVERLMQNRLFGPPEYFTAWRGPDWKIYLDAGSWPGECERVRSICADVTNQTHHWAATIEVAEATSIRLPRFYFPAWKVTVNGQAVNASADPSTGLMLITLAAGKHSVQVDWKALPAERLGLALSGCGILVLLFLIKRRGSGQED